MKKRQSLPASIWALGFVSLFMDISSEIIHSLLPLFLVSVIGANLTTVGFIEGIGEGLALLVRVFSGSLSDKIGNRKWLLIAGYGLGTISKPLFAIAASAGMVLGARSLDRIGKGIRGAPRDALIADITPVNQRGAAYGLRQSLDSVGAFIGPALAILLMLLLANDMRQVFWFALIPGLMAVAILIFFIKEPHKHTGRDSDNAIKLDTDLSFSKPFWVIITVGIVFTLARFSEAFLLLRAQSLGLSAQWVPGVLGLMSLFYAIGAYPAGILSDSLGRKHLLGIGLILLLAADIMLASASQLIHVFIGVALWGLHMAFTQGIFAALIADNTHHTRRGTAFGIFGLATGIAVILASVMAGWLWDSFGAAYTFYTGALFTALSSIGFIFLQRQHLIK